MFLYIDPGTGSMLFTILLGVIGTAFYSLRMLYIKLKQKVFVGKNVVSDKKIPIVIFAESKRYFNVFDPICRELDSFGIEILYITTSSDDPIINVKYNNIVVEVIENQNKLWAKLNFLNANIVLSTTPGLDVYQWKRSKNADYYIHIMHGPNEISLYKMFGIDYYDAVLLSGEYQAKDIRDLEKLRNLPPKDLIIVGIPYFDELKKRLLHENHKYNKNDKRTVLLAPSWGKSAMFSVFGDKIIYELIKTGYNIIIRPHPQSFISEKKIMSRLMEKYPNSEIISWNRDRDNFEALMKSDILISDFSGVIFEYALVFKKPIIYTNPNFDLGQYDAWWLKRDVWTKNALAKIGIKLTNDNIENIKNVIDKAINNDNFVNAQNEIINETWAEVENGTKNVINYIINKYKKLV